MDLPQRPNILFVVSDQHRYDWLGAVGNPHVATPNLDALADRGMTFTHCVTNSPLCVPARAALATGLLPNRTGVLDNHAYLPARLPTYYQRLRDADYRVGCVGKLDLAKPDHHNGARGDRPSVYRWGFTDPVEVEGKMHAGAAPEPLGPYGRWLQENGLYDRFHEDYSRRMKRQPVGTDRSADPKSPAGRRADPGGMWDDSVLPAAAFADAYIGSQAVRWIEERPDGHFPWHLFVSFAGPHDPFDPPAEYAERFRSAPMPPPISNPEFSGKPQWATENRWEVTDDEVLDIRRQYTAAVSVIDDQVGEILGALERTGHAENTIVIYSSDHGEMLGDHGLFEKKVPYEASLRVPLVVAGPGIRVGRSDTLVELIDVNATICELAGVARDPFLDSRSVVPALLADVDHRDTVVSQLNTFHCIRTRAHKLVIGVDGHRELYDLRNDPEELHNIAAAEPETVVALRTELFGRLLDAKWAG